MISTSTSKPLFTKKSHPCPVCGDVKGKCRTFTDEPLVLCMVADFAPGWKDLGFTKDGLWKKFVPDTGATFDRAEWQRRKLKEKPVAVPQTMSLDERDRFYRDWLSRSSLNERDRADLQRRGITDPSIALSCEFGYAVPFKGLEGKYVGAQWRYADPGDGGRYRWHNLPAGKQFPGTDEMPIAVYKVSEPTMIALIEGTGIKPMLAAERLNAIAIGAVGGNHTSSPIQLKAAIAAFPELPIVVIPDAGDVINPHVMARHKRTAHQFPEAKFLWYEQVTKQENDVDEASAAELESARLLTWDEFEAIAKSFSPLPQNWLQRITKVLQRKPKPIDSAVALERDLGELESDVYGYEPGDRLKTWQKASESGYKRILDNSKTGDAKSHDSGKAYPSEFEAERIFYISNDRRNSTVSTLADWAEVEARHGGLAPDERGKLRRVKDGQTATVAANCGRTEAIGILRSKGVHGADSNAVCQSCPMLNACKHFSGDGYGFKSARRDAFASDRLKIHGASLPDANDDFSYSRTINLWDEASTSIQNSRAIAVSVADLDQLISHLACQAPQQFVQLQPLLSGLKSLLTGDQPRYGFGYHEIVESLPTIDFSAIDWDKLHEVLKPDLSGLEPPDGINFEDFSKGAREQVAALKGKLREDLEELKRHKELEIAAILSRGRSSVFDRDKEKTREKYRLQASGLRSICRCAIEEINRKVQISFKNAQRDLKYSTAQSQSEQAEILKQTVLKQWFPEFLEVLNGGTGDVRINYSKLTLTLPDSRHREVIEASKLNIFLDATLTREDAALKLGCDPKEIFVCRQRQPKVKNLAITQVTDLGKLTQQRGDDKQRRASAIAVHYQATDPTTKVIDFKKFETDGAWWRDSRGVNDFLKVKTLVLIGTPIINIAHLLSEYSILTNTHPTEEDLGFKAYVDRTTRAEFHQAIGRLRANRRPDEQLQIIILSDFDLGIETNQVKASEITLEAADKRERFVMAFKSAASQLKANGEKITQSAIAKLIDYSQQYLSRSWKLLLTLLETPYRESSRNSNGDSEHINSLAKGIDAAINQYCDTADQVLETINEAFFEWIEPDQQLQVWQALKSQTQNRIIEVLALTLPSDELQKLGAIA